MTVYVDNSRLAWRGKDWCHLVADSIDELHTFAARLGLKREWFQERTMYPHYDVTVSVKERALAMGACPGDKRAIILCAKRLRVELTTAKRSELENIYLAQDVGLLLSTDRSQAPVQQALQFS